MKNKSIHLCLWLLIFFLGGALHLQGVVVSTVEELMTAVNNANSGGDKEIILQDGTYTLDDALGIWADGVTVRSQSGNRDAVMIYGQGMEGSVTHIFNVPGSGFTAQDMTIGRVANHAIQIWGNNNSSNILISNLHIVDTYEQMVKISYDSSSANRSENGVMENCLLEYTAGVGPQYYIGGIDGHQTKDWIVRSNVFKYISSPSGDVAEHAVHFWSDSQNTLVENNLIIDCDRGIGFGLGDRGHTGGIIRNNMIYHSSTDYGFADVGIGLENASNAQVYNNTIYMKHDYSNAIECRFPGTTGVAITNIVSNKGFALRDGCSNITISYGVFGSDQPDWFVDVSSGDLHLAYGVPELVDQGIAITGLTSDFDGDSRPQGAGIDIGADEYIQGPTEPEPTIGLNRNQLTFGAATSEPYPATQTFSISNTGEATLVWHITSNAPWLSCSPLTGTDSGLVIVYVDAFGMVAGTHKGVLTITAYASNSPQKVAVTFNMYAAGGDSPPFGSFDSPAHGSTVRSSVPVTGWALDDIEVESVKIYRDPVTGEGNNMVYIGDALLVEGARADIESAYPNYPMNYKAGWGYMMLTNFLPNGGNGTFVIYAAATDVSGHQVTLGSKTITCDNANAVKPFGAIDTPVPGGTVSGSSYRNAGWVLTPLPNKIPEDGSTIDVYVDGVNLGNPTYNVYRPDIAALFPGYANSNGAAAYFDFDTTAYTNRVHTIAWSAVDNAGNTAGIGSRYFTIQNPAWGKESMEQGAWSREKSVTCLGPVGIIKGYARGMEPQQIHPDDNGMISIEIKEMERLVIHLNNEFPLKSGGQRGGLPPRINREIYSGYLLKGNRSYPLPIGSTLDAERGIFYWQPGPGFRGDFHFIFKIKEETAGMSERRVKVKINHVPGV